MLKFYRLAAFILIAFSQGLVANAAEECEWLEKSKVDQAFPEYAPWQTMVGGAVGSCKFTSNPTQFINIFSVNQMVRSSAADAEKAARSTRTEVLKSYQVEAVPNLGKQGFRYWSKDNLRLLSFVGHQKNILVTGSLYMQGEVTKAQAETAVKLLSNNAFSLIDDPKQLAAATHCRYFDQSLLERLLPSKNRQQNVFGSTSCIAYSDEKMLKLDIVKTDQSMLSNLSSQNCTTVSMPNLGKLATLSYGCSKGKPRAQVNFAADGNVFMLSWITTKEPSEAERTTLIKLAEYAAAQSF